MNPEDQDEGRVFIEAENCQIAALPIGVLHLGVKTATLRAAGYGTIKDVQAADPEAIARLPLVGWRTVNQLVRNREALIAAVRDDAATDWARYCETIGVCLLPAKGTPGTGEEFLRELPVFFREVAAQLSDEIAVILRERICQPPGRQMTLDEIAILKSPPVSRERVRQREQKLLRQLTGGLLNDSYEGLGIHFHPGFSRWWRVAADALADIDNIGVQAFVDLLGDAWNVPPAAVMAQLPVILAIVTGEPQMSGGFRSAAKINPKLLGPLSDGLQSLSVMRLRFGKHAAALVNAGLPRLGDVLVRLRSGDLAVAGATTARHVTAHLDLLADCVTAEGEVDWASYRNAASIVRLPVSAPAGTAEFVSGLCDVVEALLRLHTVTKRAPEIFSRRTSRDARNRMTLQRVADELETYLPTVKREETVLLGWLYNAIIDHDFSSLRVWLNEAWLDYWLQASQVYDAADDYEHFSENLAWRWRLTGRDIRQAAPLLWAVLEGYPDSRRSGYTPPVASFAEAVPAGRILLKGFRRLH